MSLIVMAFYREPRHFEADEPVLQQGDLVGPVPFLSMEIAKAELVVREDGGAGRAQEADLTSTELPVTTDFMVASFARGLAIIVTQTCDLERRDRPIAVARVRSISEHSPKMSIGSNSFFEKLREWGNAGKAPTMFILPSCQFEHFEMEYSFAELLLIQTYSQENFDALVKARKLRLADTALRAFQERIAFCFGRCAVPEDLYIGQGCLEQWRKWRER